MPNENYIKMDASLTISLALTENERSISSEFSTGYDRITKLWRLIIKYHGDIQAVSQVFGAVLEILTEKYAIVTIAEQYIYAFSQQTEVEYIEKPKKIYGNLERSIRETCISQVNDYPEYNLKGDGVLIGIIDSGIDYSHPDFIRDDGTSRIAYIWDQSQTGNPPSGFSHGAEYSQNQINEAISVSTIQESLRIVPEQDTLGHGTHVSGIAAGNGRSSNGLFKGCAPNAELLIVKLGEPDYTGYPINTIDVMFAIKYLMDKAIQIEKPIAINLSYGSTIGAHDGSSLFETYVNEMALRWKTSIVAAIGNEGEKGHHTNGNVLHNQVVEFIVCEGVENLSLDIWLSGINFFDLEIINPQGISTGTIRALGGQFRYTMSNEKVFVMFNSSTPFTRKGNISIEIMNESNPLREGLWVIYFYPQNDLDTNYDIWISGFGLGNTCGFLNPTLNNTLTLPATVENVISVAGYNHFTGNISGFSGRGNISDYSLLNPDIAAPCESILSTAVLGGYDTMTGTSMAAPFMTGACALLLEWGVVQGNDPYLYGQKLKSYVHLGAKRDRTMQYPNNIWGYGKLCLLGTINLLRGGVL